MGVSTLKRDPTLPDVPTIDEAGVRGYDFYAWSNRSGKPVRMLYILIDARFEPELATLLKTRAGE